MIADETTRDALLAALCDKSQRAWAKEHGIPHGTVNDCILRKPMKLRRENMLRTALGLPTDQVSALVDRLKEANQRLVIELQDMKRENRALQNRVDRLLVSAIQHDDQSVIETGVRQAVFLRDLHYCRYCGADLIDDDYHIDHVYPRSRGGVSHMDNLVTSCKRCNRDKSNRVGVWPMPIGHFRNNDPR